MKTEDPLKAKEFDKLHKEGPKWGRHHAGAKEVANGYTTGISTIARVWRYVHINLYTVGLSLWVEYRATTRRDGTIIVLYYVWHCTTKTIVHSIPAL